MREDQGLVRWREQSALEYAAVNSSKHSHETHTYLYGQRYHKGYIIIGAPTITHVTTGFDELVRKDKKYHENEAAHTERSRAL